MREIDDWGRDPAVQRTRALFAEMEEAQRELLSRAGISPMDARLRTWRKEALARFHRSWQTSRDGDAAAVYGDCLTHVLTAAGVEVPASALPVSEGRP